MADDRSNPEAKPRYRQPEQEAVRMTIVGGRPPGCGKSVGEIPRGIEILIKKAAVDPGFRQLLLEKRAAAAGEIGLELDPAEVVMLNAVPAEQLQAIIARTHVDPKVRPALLGKAAAVMLAALGATSLTCDRVSLGVRPDTRPVAASASAKTSAVDSASDQLPRRATGQSTTEPSTNPTTVPAPTRGIQPDRPGSHGHMADRPAPKE